ncbi:papain-like cysteine protease family protein [Paraburkholderia sp. IMGN_8]|uniref:papain-like cysteine protease family protein n=1 Tax=Paraburkholderia sp. IMGN_8 TaxID=3136564 RepID=UPI003100EDF9
MKNNQGLRERAGVFTKRRRFLGIGAALVSLPAAATEFFASNATALPVDWSDQISPVRQPENIDLCWLAAAAMIQSWLAQRSVTLADAAQRLGRDYESLFAAGAGLPPAKIPDMAAKLNMKTAPLATLHPDWWAQQMTCGPMILIGMTEISPGPHARVLLNIGPGTDIEHTSVKYIDPLDGTVYLRSMAARQWFYATLPLQHPDKVPPTQVLYFDEEPTNSRLQFSVQEGARILVQ